MPGVRTMRTVAAVALLAVLVPLTGCVAAPAHPPSFTAPRGQLPAPPVSTGPVAPCTPADLDFAVEGLSPAMGDSWASLRTINRGDEACVLSGFAMLAIEQGDRALQLTVDHASPNLQPVDAVDIRLEPRVSASAALFWPGYRNAADQTSLQTVRVTLADGGTDAVALGTDVPDAPFDLVDGGALTVGPWEAPVGYGVPQYDSPAPAARSTGPCPSRDLIGGIDEPMGSSGDTAPTVVVWVANLGLLPCTVAGPLALAGPDGTVTALGSDRYSGESAVLRPGDMHGSILAWAEVAPSLASWSVLVGEDQRIAVSARPVAEG